MEFGVLDNSINLSFDILIMFHHLFYSLMIFTLRNKIFLDYSLLLTTEYLRRNSNVRLKKQNQTFSFVHRCHMSDTIRMIEHEIFLRVDGSVVVVWVNRHQTSHSYPYLHSYSNS